MSEPILNFRYYPGTFEIRRFHEISDSVDRENPEFELSLPNTPFLVRTGPEDSYDLMFADPEKKKVITPKPRVLDQVIRKLLAVRLTKQSGLHWPGTPEEADQQFSDLGKHVLDISKHIGMLHWGGDIDGVRFDREPLADWWLLIQQIQYTFSHSGDATFEVGLLEVLLCSRSGNATIEIQSKSTKDAIMYRLAQMIAGGTTQLSCESCGAPILVGGAGRDSKSKKRADARFCSDKCRSTFHNEARRKAARKSRL
jgi:hypothetical protein